LFATARWAPRARRSNGSAMPGQVPQVTWNRHRIAVAHGVIAAALRPADHRKNTVAHRPQPAAFLAGRKGHKPALLGGIDQK